MRVGHKYFLVRRGETVDRAIARTEEEHRRENPYDDARDLRSSEEFLRSRYVTRWVREAHDAYKRSLADAGRILSVGSGLGEHDVLLHLAGFDIVSTDLLPGVAAETQRLFPKMEFATFDCFDQASYARFRFDSILATGVDYLFDDATLARFFDVTRAALAKSTVAVPRLVFTIRYRDNALTRLIDEILLPFEARVRRLRHGSDYEIVRKAHGFRRSRAEAVRIAREHGFVLRSVRYAGRGVECERSGVLRRLPLFVPMMRLVDRVFPVSCNSVILELTPA